VIHFHQAVWGGRVTFRKAGDPDAEAPGIPVPGKFFDEPDEIGRLKEIVLGGAGVARDGGKLRRGPVELVLVAPDLDGEVEIDLPDRYPLTPQVIGALKTVPGVVYLEEF